MESAMTGHLDGIGLNYGLAVPLLAAAIVVCKRLSNCPPRGTRRRVQDRRAGPLGWTRDPNLKALSLEDWLVLGASRDRFAGIHSTEGVLRSALYALYEYTWIALHKMQAVGAYLLSPLSAGYQGGMAGVSWLLAVTGAGLRFVLSRGYRRVTGVLTVLWHIPDRAAYALSTTLRDRGRRLLMAVKEEHFLAHVSLHLGGFGLLLLPLFFVTGSDTASHLTMYVATIWLLTGGLVAQRMLR
jgi:hypothetical protein